MSEEGTSLKINSTKPGRISGSFGRISRPWKSVWVPFLALGRFSIIIPRRDHSSRQLGQIFVCLIVSIFAFIRFMKKLAILFNNSRRETLNRCSKHFSLDRRLDGLIFSPIFKFLRSYNPSPSSHIFAISFLSAPGRQSRFATVPSP